MEKSITTNARNRSTDKSIQRLISVIDAKQIHNAVVNKMTNPEGTTSAIGFLKDEVWKKKDSGVGSDIATSDSEQVLKAFEYLHNNIVAERPQLTAEILLNLNHILIYGKLADDKQYHSEDSGTFPLVKRRDELTKALFHLAEDDKDSKVFDREGLLYSRLRESKLRMKRFLPKGFKTDLGTMWKSLAEAAGQKASLSHSIPLAEWSNNQPSVERKTRETIDPKVEKMLDSMPRQLRLGTLGERLALLAEILNQHIAGTDQEDINQVHQLLARIQCYIDWCHCFTNGNIRTARVLVAYLRECWHLPPSAMYDPNIIDLVSIDAVAYLEELGEEIYVLTHKLVTNVEGFLSQNQSENPINKSTKKR